MTDKFISINYRHADHSRHTIQIEKFYIDALKAIGIDDVAKFAAENAGVSQVTRNVKRAIINELVKRATSELNTIQSTSELNSIQSTSELNSIQSTSELNTIQSTSELNTIQSTSELNTIQSTSELNTIQSTTQSTSAEWLDGLPIAESNGQCTQLTGTKLTKQCKNKAFKAGYCKLHYAEYIKAR
jgi:hypothetical protein